MAWRKRDRAPVDRITSDRLAEFGRFGFLGEQSGCDFSELYAQLGPLNELVFTQLPDDRAVVIAELHRHAAKGAWEKVGAWKYVREFLDESPDTQPLIDGGLLAVQRMNVTNLGLHLALVDSPRYRELTGGPIPNDGFFGPPVFESEYGPDRSFYLGLAVRAAADRRPTRVPSAPGVPPGALHETTRAMWDFGLLVHRGPMLVSPEIRDEPSVVRPAVQAADNVDHELFAERLAELVLDSSAVTYGAWTSLGSARFIEEYLDRRAGRSPAYARLLDNGLTQMERGGLLGLALPVEVLTPSARERLQALRSGSGVT